MADNGVTIKMEGGALVVKHVDGMKKRIANLQPALKAGASAVNKLMADSFRGSKSPEGAPWPPLSETTIANRTKKSTKPLIDTGVLKNSVHANATKDSIFFGTNIPYAGPQNFGATIKGKYKPRKRKKKDPARHNHPVRAEHVAAGERLQKANALHKLNAALGVSGRFGGKSRVGQTYSFKIPPRPFLPYDKESGEFMSGGEAGVVLHKISNYVRNYVTTGKARGE